MRYSYTPTKEFIERRNALVRSDRRYIDLEEKYRRWDAEAPEHHQAEIDPKQVLYEGWHCDTWHDELGSCDYKQFAKKGVHISPAIKREIESGMLDTIIVWRWADGNRWNMLREGVPVDYEIMGQVKASDVLSHLFPDGNGFRFKFPLEK